MARCFLVVVVLVGLTNVCEAQNLAAPVTIPRQVPTKMPARSVNKLMFDRIRPGMSNAEVSAILGGEESYHLFRPAWGRMQRLWVIGNSELVVWFVGDEVEGAAYAPDVTVPALLYVLPASKALTTLPRGNAQRFSIDVYNEIGGTREEVVALLGCPSLQPTQRPLEELDGTSASRSTMREGERWDDGNTRIWVTFNKQGEVNGAMISTTTFSAGVIEAHHPTLDKVILVERLGPPEVEN